MNTTLYVNIAECLPIQDLTNFISILEDENEDLKMYVQVKYRASSRIITRFMKRIVGLHQTISYFPEFVERHDITPFLKRKFMEFYFFDYPKQYVGSWYMNSGVQWKDEIRNQYQRRPIENPSEVSRWDLWQLHQRMEYDEILAIGW